MLFAGMNPWRNDMPKLISTVRIAMAIRMRIV
jgi:hypothetical protein